jgi:hypothetical protein
MTRRGKPPTLPASGAKDTSSVDFRSAPNTPDRSGSRERSEFWWIVVEGDGEYYYLESPPTAPRFSLWLLGAGVTIRSNGRSAGTRRPEGTGSAASRWGTPTSRSTDIYGSGRGG